MTVGDVSLSRMPGVTWACLFWGVAVGVPMSGVFVVIGANMLDGVAEIATLPHDAPAGPSLYEGTIVPRTNPAVSPSGAAVVGWASEVLSAVHMGKSTVTNVYCQQSDFSQMDLADVHGRWRLPIAVAGFAPTHGAMSLVVAVTRSSRPSAVVEGVAVEQPQIPPAVTGQCALAPLGEHEVRTYVERQLPVGASVTFAGCRTAAGLGPCPGDSRAAGHLVRGTASEFIGHLLVGAATATLLVWLFLAFSVVVIVQVILALRRYLRLGAMPW